MTAPDYKSLISLAVSIL